MSVPCHRKQTIEAALLDRRLGVRSPAFAHAVAWAVAASASLRDLREHGLRRLVVLEHGVRALPNRHLTPL
jgi:hypothetical protein